ncbi:MAG: hypothetical protein J07HR59_00815, partial [Halorubrum sp. J07HR59]
MAVDFAVIDEATIDGGSIVFTKVDESFVSSVRW